MTAIDASAVGSPDRRIVFVLNGVRRELSRSRVESALADVVPEPVRKHAVRVAGTWFPVRQAFEHATGLPRHEFTSHTARRHLVALGFEVHGDITSRALGAEAAHAPASRPSGEWTVMRTDDEWHTEARVQAAVVSRLVADGWHILRVADTAARQHGLDIEAARGDERLGVEVKGYPSSAYADPARSGQAKPTRPSTQAGHWYAAAVVAAMRLRGRRPDVRSVIALPDFPRYRDLYAETATSLSAAAIDVWWVGLNGAVDVEGA
jgi:hypothetical protein